MENEIRERLEERLARLEKQGRWWRAAALLLAVFLGLLWTAAFAGQDQFDRGFILPHPPEDVRARTFLLTDQSGKVHGEWTIEGNQAVMKFYGPNGKVLWFAPPRAEFKPAEAKQK